METLSACTSGSTDGYDDLEGPHMLDGENFSNLYCIASPYLVERSSFHHYVKLLLIE